MIYKGEGCLSLRTIYFNIDIIQKRKHRMMIELLQGCMNDLNALKHVPLRTNYILYKLLIMEGVKNK